MLESRVRAVGLPYAHGYSCRDHFKERAMERLGVDEERIETTGSDQHVPSLHHLIAVLINGRIRKAGRGRYRLLCVI